MKTMLPLGKRVILVKEEAPEASEGGIVIPETSREKPLTARVTAVGPGIGGKYGRIHVGDEVVYASFAGTDLTIDGRDIIVVDEEDIMLVLQEVVDVPNTKDN